MSDTSKTQAVESENESAKAETEPEEVDTSHLDDTDEQSSSSHRAHLDGVDDGCGCAEVWEHLSEERDE